MTFEQLQLDLKTQKAQNKFKLDLNLIAPNIINDLDDLLSLNNGSIQFNSPQYSEFDNGSSVITINTKYRLTKFFFNRADVEVAITFINNKNKIDYIITIEPEGAWGTFLGNEVVRILKNLNINPDNIIFYFTSVKGPIDLEFDDDGDKLIYEIIPISAYNIITHFKSKILEDLGLKDNIFQINIPDKTISKIIKCDFTLLDVVTFEATEIIVRSFDNIDVKVNYSLIFMPGLKPITIKNNTFKLSLDTFQLETEIPDELVLANNIPGIKVWNLKILFGGSIEQRTYTYGARGNFGTAKDKAKDKPELESNSFELQYSNVNTSPIPSLFDGQIKELTFNKGIEMLIGASPNFPSFFDEVLSFHNLNLYWCTQPGFILRSGSEAPVGFGAFSEFKLIGIDGYAELYYYQEVNEVKGIFMIEPIKIPGLIEIGGNSEGYKDVVKPGGMEFNFKVENEIPEFEASIKTTILKDIEALNATAKFDKHGISFSFKQTLPFAPVVFKGTVKKKGDVTININVELSTPKKSFDVSPFGKINMRFFVGCKGELVIKNFLFESFKFKCVFELFGESIAVTVDLKADELDDFSKLPYFILEAIISKLKKIFTDAFEWLKGVVQGVIKIAENLKDQAIKIAQRLKQEFGNKVKEIVELLKKAEVGCKLAALVLSEGLEVGAKEIAKLLKSVEYKSREIVEALKVLVGDSPKLIFEILEGADFTYKEIGKAFSGMSSQLISYAKKMDIKLDDVADMLNGMGKSTDQAVKILATTFKIGSKVKILSALKDAKFDTSDVEESFKKVFRVKITAKKPSTTVFGKKYSL